MATVRLYHGTASSFEAFDDRFALRGAEPNSALGIHLTESPWLASCYGKLAAGYGGAAEPVVLAVDVDVERIAMISSRDDFLGRAEGMPLRHSDRQWSDYVSARQCLEDAGFHGVAGDDLGHDLLGAWVIFQPKRVEIVERISPEAAQDMEADPFYPDVEFVETALFGELASVPAA